MGNSPTAQHSREATSFTRYLVGRPATDRVAARYEEALELLELDRPSSAFENRLLRVAGFHPLTAELLDTACALLARETLLRRRMFVLAGLLETEPSYADRFLASPPGRLGVVAGLAMSGLRGLLDLIFGTPLLLAIRWTS